MNKLRCLFRFIFLLATLSAISVCQAAEVSFEVKERAGITRSNETVVYSIPLSQTADILSTSSMEIVGYDAAFTVLSRYGGAPSDTTKPIRVVLVAFQDSFLANQTKKYTFLTSGNGPIGGAGLAEEKAGYVEISTGAAIFRISKSKGNIFDFVSIGGTTVLSSPPEDGFYVELKGVLYSSGNAVPTVEIEENNPIFSIIKVSGEFKDNSGNTLYPADAVDLKSNKYKADSPLRYTLRYYAYKNKSYVRLFATLKNENYGSSFYVTDTYEPIHNAYIDQAFLKTTLTGLASNKTVQFDGFSREYSSGKFDVYQDEISPMTSTSHNWQYTFNGQTIKVGKYSGGANVRDSNAGLFVADRWFWEQFPNQLSVENNSVSANLWPDTGNTHRLLGGSWKTHEMLYYFHSNDNDFSDELAYLRKRPVIWCTGDYYSKSNFTWGMLPGKITLDEDVTFPAGESLQNALDRHSKRHRSILDSDYLDSGNSILDLMEKKSIKFNLSDSPMRYFNWYGWLNFGAIPRAANFGYSNQHYDWSFTALSGFLRFNDFKQFEMGEIWVNHLCDLLTVHDPDATGTSGPMTLTDYDIHGGQRDEQDALMSYYPDRNIAGAVSEPRGMSHMWTKGMALQYLLTGERRYVESLEHVWEHVDRMRNSTFNDNFETRHQWRGIDALVEGYLVNGSNEQLAIAYNMFYRNLLSREGGNCKDLNDPTTCTPDGVSGWLASWYETPNLVWAGYDSWGIEFCIKLHERLTEAGMVNEAKVVKLFLGRWAMWIKNTVFGTSLYPFGEYYNNLSEYYPYSFANNELNPYTGANPDNAWNSSYSFVYADLLMFQYEHSGDENFKKLADVIFKDFQFYNYTAGKQQTKKTSYPVDGWWDNTPSGSWKLPKEIYNPAYYVKHYFDMQERNRPIIKSITEP